MSSFAGLGIPARVLFPERDDPSDHWADRLARSAQGLAVVGATGLMRRRMSRIVTLAGRHSAEMASADSRDVSRMIQSLRTALRREQLSDDAIARSFALVREIADRQLGMRHFDVQLIGGYAMLKGMIAEMETGEGKSLTATLAAVTAALAGIPVHVITVNDYLANRDAEQMAPVYRAFGLTVGAVVGGMPPEARRAAYQCDIAYCTNKEVAFDYLRDRISLGGETSNLRLKLERMYGEDVRADQMVMRGLHFAIVDEADSVLVDEARTPLIISGKSDAADDRELIETANKLAARLELDRDYEVLIDENRVALNANGRARLHDAAQGLAGMWRGAVFREEIATQALAARHIYHRDEHYLVRDGKVQIIDEYTGRVMADRFWGDGLHQLIEAKEGCEITGRNITLARMTYQRFFRRYLRLAGMTGTARQVASELWSVYRLPVLSVPTNKPSRRRHRPDRICATLDEKWRAVTDRASELQRAGLPVLVGTRSVAASEEASRRLTAAGIEHCVLSAAQDEDEAEIIGRAGQAGQVTVATNMAGRGTDIKLTSDVATRGGLHVILTERHEAGRIDRQLAGRSGRQGDPGSVEAILSLEDPLLEFVGARRYAGFLYTLQWEAVRAFLARHLFDRAQRRAQRAHARIRRELLKADRRLGKALAFSGRME